MGRLGLTLIFITLMGVPAMTHASSSRKRTECASDSSLKAAQAAAAAVPGPMTLEAKEARHSFLRSHLAEYFDPTGTGVLDFTRYAEYQWATLIIDLDEPKCRLTFDDWLELRFGSRDAIQTQAARSESWMRTQESDFRFHGGGKGYIERADYERLFRSNFEKFQASYSGGIPLDRLER